MNNYTVYMHTCPNGRRYIGLTKQDVESRWLNGNGYAGQYFNLAIKEFGWNNIKHEILIDGLSQNQAWILEEKFIQAYDLTNPDYGYNVLSGALDAPTPTPDTIRKIRAANIKGVLQMEQRGFDDYVIVAEYPSIIEAARAMGAVNSGNISKALRSKYNYAYGYYWRYAEVSA